MRKLIAVKETNNCNLLYVSEQNEILVYELDKCNQMSEMDIRDQLLEVTEDACAIASVCVVDGWLERIKIEDENQLATVGIDLIKHAQKELELLRIPGVKEHNNYKYSLTPNAERVILECIKQGVVSSDMCVFSGPEILEEAESDPKQVSWRIKNAFNISSVTEGLFSEMKQLFDTQSCPEYNKRNSSSPQNSPRSR